jgi:hypothetical protein
MKIAEVIDQSVLAIFRDEKLSENMVLKGGSALRMLEQDRSRLSIDADFSVRVPIKDTGPYFDRIKRALSDRFEQQGFCVIDFIVTPRPETPKTGHPLWWKGWQCEFKLVQQAHSRFSLEVQRRRAFIPEGSNTSKIMIDISEHEYCGLDQKKPISGVLVYGYSKELLILEKLRAICQQYPEYRFHSNKNRARDFYDIYRLSRGLDNQLICRCRDHLNPVFDAKEVPVAMLKALWDEDFLAIQRLGFDQVGDSVEKPLFEFEIYLERVRYLVMEIYPEIYKTLKG